MENDSKSQGILLAILTAVCYGMMSIFVETFYLYGGTSGSFNLLKCIIIMVNMLPFIILLYLTLVKECDNIIECPKQAFVLGE